jgi:extracellular elastinolytic metalloproteinase
VIAWADVNDDNLVGTNEKTPVPGNAKGATFPLQHFGQSASSFCSPTFVCTWDPNTVGSWKKNRNADVAQAFYLASNFHDYLTQSPIKFTPKAGNFSANGGDPVLLNALDGAATDNGMPDGNHIDNANMNTPPDGTPPTMQMYLWHFPGATDAQDPFVPTSSAFDASVEYHEYTHGLSNRLVIDANGNSTLNSIQAGSMGEAWSDYYAMDYLVTKGFVKDTASSGQVFEGRYLTAGAPFRTMAIDCAVGATASGCTALDNTKGGYTYGDFPTVGGSPEVHASGEVWAQTLWDIRKAFGHTVADTLITRAMSLSADDPSFLDMRNAIIQADLVAYGQSHTPALWKIFAQRGMGFFAGAIDGNDIAPAEDFHRPPAPTTARTSISGTVTDPTTGLPVEGAVVVVAGQGSQFSDVTAADGSYSIGGLYAGTYQKVVASAPGYIPDAHAVDSTSGTPADFSITRDWVASSGGAEIVDFNGGDFTAFGCGPDGAIDLSQGTGWGSTTGDDQGTPTNVFVPKHITIDMTTAVDISSFGVDPTATCGDGGSASTGDFRIETSPDGNVWTTAAEGAFTSADRGQINDVTPTAGDTGVRFVKFTILGNQTPDFATNCPDGAFSGCSFSDLTEIEVFGSASP